MNQLLTVIVQTSPIPSHPSTALLEALFRSFDRVDGLRECRILIVADGCEAISAQEQEGLKRGKVTSDSANRYQQHLKRLKSCMDNVPFGASAVEQGSVELLILDERHGSAKAIEYVVNTKIHTPFVMIAQHDNFFVANVPLRFILSAMEHNPSWLKAVHFQATATTNYVDKVKRRYGLDIQPRVADNLEYPLIPLVFWFGRTHVARTDYYRDFVLNRKLQTGDHLEELLGETQLKDILKNGMAVHALYGNYVLNQGKEVLYHLSGRRARAVQEGSEQYGNSSDLQQQQQEANVNYDQVDKNVVSEKEIREAASGSTASFTTARSCRAVAPGLELLPLPNSGPPPTGRFRQKCFHCGVKGHSYRHCPDVKVVETDTIDLS